MRALLFLLLAACSASPTPHERYDNVHLLLFSAPWCGGCNEEIPEVDRHKGKLDPRAYITVYVVTDVHPASQPTEAGVAAYKAKLGVGLDMQPDFRRQIYRTYFQESGLSLPAAALTTDVESCVNEVCTIETRLLRRFSAGSETVRTLFEAVRSYLK